MTHQKDSTQDETESQVSFGNQAMLNAIAKKFSDSARQHCVVHKMDNVLSSVPTKQQEQLKP